MALRSKKRDQPSPEPESGSTPAPRRTATANTEPAPVKARRRPALIALGLAVIATGALGGAWAFSAHNEDRTVVVARTNLQPGHKVESSDLTTTTLSGADGAQLVAGKDLSSLVGDYPVTTVPNGTLLTTTMLTNTLDVRAGTTIVAIPVKVGQVPGSGLRAGDPVTLVLTAGSGSSNLPADLKPGQSWEASVASVHEQNAATAAQNTTQVVDVSVSSGTAKQVAEAAGTGQVALTLNAAGGK